MNQKGAILPSVVIFVFLLATVTMGTARIYKNQMQQMKTTENYYVIQTMLELSKAELREQLTIDPDLQEAFFTFKTGTVRVQKISGTSYLLTGTADKSFLKQLSITVDMPADSTVSGKAEQDTSEYESAEYTENEQVSQKRSSP